MFTSTSTKTSGKIPQTYLENPLFASKKCFGMSTTANSMYMSQTTNPTFMKTQATTYPMHTKTSYNNSQRFKWKELMKVAPYDIESAQPYISNILFGKLDEEEVQIVPENYITHLVRVLQTIAVNAINEKNSLEEQNKQLNNKVNELLNEVNEKNNHIELIDSLQRQNKEMKKLIKSYNTTFSNFDKNDHGNLIDSDEDNLIPKPRIKQRYYCQYCSGKKFSSVEYLEDHMRRRHLIDNYKVQEGDIKIKKVKKTTDIDSKINETKSEMQNLLISTQMSNNYQTINDKISQLQSKLYQTKFGNTTNYSNTMMNMSSTVNPQKETVLIKNSNGSQSNRLSREDAYLLQQTIQKINSQIEKNNKENSKRFHDLSNEMNKFRILISNELSSMKQSRSFDRVKTSMSLASSQGEYSTNIKYINPIRRKNKMNTVRTNKLSSLNLDDNNKKEIKMKSSTERVDTTREMEHLQTISTNNREFSNDQSMISKEPMKVTKVANDQIIKPQHSLKQEEEHIIVKENSININNDIESVMSQTIEEKEIQDFYIKFKNRDKNYNGYLVDYLQNIIPETFKLNDEYIERKKNMLGSNKLSTITENEITSIGQLNNLSKDGLINLINEMYEHIGNKAMDPQSEYGYYSTNLELLFGTKELIDEENHNYFFKRNNSISSFNKKFFNYVDYTIVS